jgi:hypothetical protein
LNFVDEVYELQVKKPPYFILNLLGLVDLDHWVELVVLEN